MKSMMKKVLSLGLVAAVTASIAIGGTMAYLTSDAGTKSNSFKVGGIDVELTEEVGVTTNGGGTVTRGEDGAAYEGLLPGDKITKKVTVSNTGNDDAYVRVTVTLNNADKINTAIDEFYGDDKAQEKYNEIFVGWGLNHSKDLNNDGTNDAGMRLTITGDDMPEHVLQVDSVKTIDEYALFYSGNWFGEQEDIIPFDGYYTKNMDTYEMMYTYYILLPAGEATTLFEGLNIPKEFNAEQLEMFEGLEISIDADAIQAANMTIADQYINDPNGKAKTAFGILAGNITSSDYDTELIGSITPGYTRADAIWGEGGGNAKESVAIKVYSGETYMGQTSLNNINGIIDGDVYVTWSIILDAESNSDEYWNMKWEKAPSIDLQPTKVEMWIDGEKVAENEVRLNSPDDLHPIIGYVVGTNGTILRYVDNETAVNIQNGETYVPLNPNIVTVNGSTHTDLKNAIESAESGDTVQLTENINLGSNQLALEKNIVLDLNEKTISADNRWGIISVKNGASIKNGTIDVNTNVAAIRAFNAGLIENVTINADPKAEDKVVTGIAVQNNGYVGTIKNVTINGRVTQGIEVAKGAKVDLIDNASVTAVSNGTDAKYYGNALILNAGYVGKAVNCNFNGAVYGVHMMLNGEFDVALDLQDCDVTGGEAAIYAHDEAGISNTTNCSLSLTYDAATILTGGLTWNFEDECLGVVTLNAPSAN